MTRRDEEYELLRQAIRELRHADEAGAPTFGTVRARRRSRGPSIPRATVFAIAAALVLIVGSLFAWRATRRPSLVVPGEVVALSLWKPSTDVLMRTPTRALLSETPRLGASLVTIRLGELR